MKKVRMIVEMDEELYKAFAEQDVFISGMRTGKTLLSEIWKALKNATIVRMSEEKIKESCSLSIVYNEGFDKGYEKAKAEYELNENDDAVSREEAIHCVTETELYNETFAEAKMRIAELKPVLPKRERGKWIGDKAYPICPKCNCNIIEEYISCSDYAEMYKPMKYCPNCGAEMAERGEK